MSLSWDENTCLHLLSGSSWSLIRDGCVSGSGATGLMHYDGSGTDEGVMSMIARVQELSYGYPEGRLELSLIGAYSSHNYSVELFYSLMGM